MSRERASGFTFVEILVALAVAILFGAPLFVGLAGIALVFFISVGDPIASVPLLMVSWRRMSSRIEA